MIKLTYHVICAFVNFASFNGTLTVKKIYAEFRNINFSQFIARAFESVNNLQPKN